MASKQAKIILLYGFSVEYDCDNIDHDEYKGNEEYELDKDVKVYNMPYYGEKKSKQLRYVGIKFGEVMSVFNNLHYSSDTLQITKLKPSKEIKNKMKLLFPHEKIQEQAIIQNVYTSHYVQGNIYCGYFVSANVDENDLVKENYLPDIENYLEENKNNLEMIWQFSHNISDNNQFMQDPLPTGLAKARHN